MVRLKGNWATREVWLNDQLLNPKESLKVRNHSPDGFNWGYMGSGPAQLALAVLLRFGDRQWALMHYQSFKQNYIAILPHDDFEVEIPLPEGGIT